MTIAPIITRGFASTGLVLQGYGGGFTIVPAVVYVGVNILQLTGRNTGWTNETKWSITLQPASQGLLVSSSQITLLDVTHATWNITVLAPSGGAMIISDGVFMATIILAPAVPGHHNAQIKISGFASESYSAVVTTSGHLPKAMPT